MNPAVALLPKLDTLQLRFFAKKIAINIDQPLTAIFSDDKLRFYEDEIGLTANNLKTLEDFTKYIYSLAAGAKSFDPAREVMDQVGLDEERSKIFEKIFQDNAQTIVDSLKRKISATDNLVENIGMRVSLPLVESEIPLVQELSMAQRIKFSHSPDVRQPKLNINFKMKTEETEAHGGMVNIDLDKTQALNLFQEIEKIKEHLDKIYGN